VSSTRWSSSTTAANLTTLDVRSGDGSTSKGSITLDGTESLTAVARKITDSELGLTASVVQVKPGEYALQVTATKSGAAAGFRLAGAETFKDTSTGRDAQLRIGTTANAYDVFSPTNTFDGVLPGATLTVSKKETDPVTVSVGSNPDGVAGAVQRLVDAVNSALTQVNSYTSNAAGSTAALKGDFSVTRLAGQLLNAVSYAVGDDGSAAKLGIQLTRDGKVTFDRDVFLAGLEGDPALAQRMIGGTPGSGGAAAVPGIAERLLGVAKAASDGTTGSLVRLAEGQDGAVKDMQARIEGWDLRLEKRREMLTRQFSAMETALSSLRNQSTWLAGQINSLPSYS
jgi:flagellar capping protein FliD